MQQLTVESIVFSLFEVQMCRYTLLLLSSFVFSQICFFANVLLLHALSLRVLASPTLAYTATLCFIFNPASVFYNVAYSESSFFTLALAGMLLWERRQCLLAAIV